MNKPKHTDPSRSNAMRSYLSAYGFMAPAGILVIIFFLIPVAIILYLSVTNLASSNFTSNLFEMEFVGLKNYRTLLNDQFARKIFFNTFFYVLITLSIFNVSLALIVSLLTTHIDRNAGFVFRALWILPRITSPVVYILLWKRMMAEAPFGIINQFNEMMGQPTYNYIATNPWVFVVVVNGFIGLSFGMIIFTSAIESIPKDLLNASLVDGSSRIAAHPLRDPAFDPLAAPLCRHLSDAVTVDLLCGNPALDRWRARSLSHRGLVVNRLPSRAVQLFRQCAVGLRFCLRRSVWF